MNRKVPAESARADSPQAPRRTPAAGRAGMPGQKAVEFWPTVRRIVRELAQQRVAIIGVLVLGLLSVILQVAGPALLGRVTNVIVEGFYSRRLADVVPVGATQEETIRILTDLGRTEEAQVVSNMPDLVIGSGVDFTRLGMALLIVLSIYAASFLSGWMQGRIATIAVQQTVHELRLRVQAKLNRLPLRFIDKNAKGELLSRVTNDIDNVGQTLQQVLSQLITSVLSVLGILIMMVWISPSLALVAVIMIPLTGVVVAVISRRSQPQFVEQWRRTGTLNAHVEENYTAHALVTTYGQAAAANKVMAEENNALYEASFKAQFLTGLIQPISGFLSNLSYILIAVIGALRVIGGSLTIGEVQAFIQYSRQFSQPVSQVASMANMFQSGAASAERIYQILDEEEETPDAAQELHQEPVRGEVIFQDVQFSYNPGEPVIEHLNLNVQPGQTVAIVGHTGAGKTTLVNLLMRFYEIDSGAIYLDGANISDLTRYQLRSNIGMVLQDTWLFRGTIAENIAYGADHEVTMDEIRHAAQATGVDHIVAALPEGYDTVLDQESTGGTALSQGERQLITIARAFLSNPSILVLDEATSSVDTRTEVLVQQAMNALRKGRTSFVIAHRLSTIRDAEVIVVMDQGKIVEKGNHEQLLAAGGHYAELYQSQFTGPALS